MEKVNKYIGFNLLLLFTVFAISTIFNSKDLLAADNHGKPFEIESTAYCYGKYTKDGSKVREGIISAKEEWIGKGAIVYEDNSGKPGDVIGIYEIKDTGGDYRIKNGSCIDIYFTSEADCKRWGRKNVFIQIIDAKGVTVCRI